MHSNSTICASRWSPASARWSAITVPGDYFELSGEDLSLPPGQSFPIYPLAALLPLLPAKQRSTHPHDWMTKDAEVACPDPHCGARFRIIRTGTSTFRHGEVTRVPLEPGRDAPA